MNAGQKQHVRKYSRYTDHRIRKNKSIMERRLDSGVRERAALNFLLKQRKGESSLIEEIYCILAMKNLRQHHPRVNTELEEQWGAILRENKEIVDRVIHTLFQWFGTNVGRAELLKLSEILKGWPNEPSEKLKKTLQKMSITPTP